jgi:hypothetical protein
MGAWGYGPFENDPALDWLYSTSRLLDGSSFEPLTKLFAKLLDESLDYLEVDDASAVVVASLIVAALADHDTSNLPEDVQAWVKDKNADLSPIKQAREALHKVATDSELKELWEEVENYDNWQAINQEILSRLDSKLKEG